jgi:hypothetical protein
MDLHTTYRRMGADGNIFDSPGKGTVGGHRGTKACGWMDCRSALEAIAKGGFRQHQVSFAGEAIPTAAGFRPDHACLPEKYAAWKATRAA